VTFAPLSTGSFPSALTITSNAYGQSSTTVVLNGYGTFPAGISATKTDNNFLSCFPNPFSGAINIKLNLLTGQAVHFELTDASGSVLYILDRIVPAGTRIFESSEFWPASIGLPDGIYFIKVISEKMTGIEKIVKVGR